MAVHIISFYDEETDPGVVNTYSEIWSFLETQYGNPINNDGNGSCFRGRIGETAVLTDDLKTNIHQLVLINVPSEIITGLERLLDK